MSKKFGITVLIASLGVFTIGLCGVIWCQERNIKQTQEVQKDYRLIKEGGKRYEYNSSLVTIMLLGIDSSNTKHLGQADFISLLLLDREKKAIKLLSISRDTMTKIQLKDAAGNNLGWETQHLALSYAYGSSKENGSMLTMAAVSELLNDIPIINFVSADVTTIASFHEIVGDLEVVIPDDSLSYLNIGWDKGKKITLTTDNAEQFLRSRNIEKAYTNETRRVRQKVYIEAYVKRLKEMLQTDFSSTVKKLATNFDKTTTNLSLDELEAYAEMVMTYEFDEQGFYNLSGQEKEGAFHDEYVIDENAKDELIRRLFYKER